MSTVLVDNTNYVRGYSDKLILHTKRSNVVSGAVVSCGLKSTKYQYLQKNPAERSAQKFCRVTDTTVVAIERMKKSPNMQSL